MTVKTFNTRIKLKYDCHDNWKPAEGTGLVLLQGEFGYDSTKKNFFIGDATTGSKSLKYVIGESIMADYVAAPNSVTLTDPIANSDSLNVALAKLQSQVGAATNSSIIGITMNGANVTLTNHVAALGDQVTTFGGENGAITLGNGLQMGTGGNAKQVSAKVVTGNGLSLGAGGIAMATVVTSTNGEGGSNGAMTAAQAEKLVGIATGAQVNVLEGVQVNGTNLTITNKKVNVTVAEGTTNGTIKVNGTDVAVHGLGSAAYTNSTAYEAAFTDGSHRVATMGAHTPGTGETATQKIEFFKGTQSGGSLGTDNTAPVTLYFKSAVTAANPILTSNDVAGIVGSMVYKGAVDSQHALPASPSKGDVYMVGGGGTYAGKACEVGDMLVYNGTSWDAINGENQVSNSGATITAGDGNTTIIAFVDGTAISAKVNVTAGSATIASKDGNIIRLNTGVTQGTNTGTIANTTGENTIIKLADVAATGAANELTVTSATYGGSIATTNAQTALTNLATAISDVNTAIGNLDATVDADTITGTPGTPLVTKSTPNADFTVLNSVVQTDGKLTGGTAYNLKKVAATGAAGDVSLADTGDNYTATTVEGAFTEIAAWELILNCGSATTETY